MPGQHVPLDPLSASLRNNEEARSGYSAPAPINAAKMVDTALHVKRSDRSTLKSDRIALPILVNIPRAEIEQGTIQTRALYVVEVLGFGERSVVKYPFEKFEELYNAVSRKTQYALPALPQSQWFGSAKAEVVEERRCKLQELLQKILMLQEVLNDHEELLWKFLQLPRPVVVAARFLACPPTAKRVWLDRLWEASADKGGHKALQHPMVEKELVQLARDACDDGEGQQGRSVPEEAFGEASIACDLLARIFQRSDDAERDASLGAIPERHRWIEVLLMCVRAEEPRLDAPTDEFGQDNTVTVRRLPLRETASKALRTLAISGRQAWTKTLAAFLREGGLLHLKCTADTFSGDAGEGASRQPFQRLVTELLLRGFDKPVVELFASNGWAKERRALLNTLFMSNDAFVRILVGLFLCGLLCEDGFADEQKAQLGVQALLADLQQKSAELSQADICLLLLEPDIWSWLCSLVAVKRPLVNTFALLVVLFVVVPTSETVFETEGLHQTLLSLCDPEADPTSRYFASKLLLTAHRQGEGEGIVAPLAYPELGSLCSCLAINFQAQYEYDLGQQDLLESEVTRACQWSEAASNMDDLQQQARADAASLRSEASEWTASVAMAGKSTDLTRQNSNQVAEALAAFSLSLDSASNAIGDGTPSMEEVQLREELRAEEERLAEYECELSELGLRSQLLAEEKNVLSQTMAEKDEVASRLQANIHEATENAQEAASLGTPPGLATLLSDCRQRHMETLEHLSALRARSELLDAQLAEMCEPIPRLNAEIERSRCRVEELVARSSAVSHSSAVVETWGRLMDRQRECGKGHETVRRSLRDVRGCVTSERERRRALRASVQQLQQTLMHLDTHLETLEVWDALDAEGGFLSSDINS